MSNSEESLAPLEAAVEILGDDHSSSPGEQQRDYVARVRASRVLKRYQSGFTPNLLPHADLMAFDAIFASKVILKLLYLSLAEDARCSVGEQRSAYQQAENDAIASKTRVAQSSGKLLYQLGGTSLLETIIEDWIPELDQRSLRAAWQTYLG
ncbi:hypothetical protein C1752_03685 [Acaryochloris thomasi RCC1774]|uniref:Uncharacterized protein n=1 Tax=Acaryochloris thomasi RCC1774 TaxID=1764569 RepID=A0A2W1JFW6_9CYAN|nr:hypothetical protein [Acaryochloris thomasi]PZD72489.1 hypothetical protein C1752_03685 [Acaryochloris thomasi RCC1774]